MSGIRRVCLDEDTLVAWVERSLSGQERTDAVAHLGGCARCRERVAANVALRGVDAPFAAAPGTVEERPIDVGPALVRATLRCGPLALVVAETDAEVQLVPAIAARRGASRRPSTYATVALRRMLPSPVGPHVQRPSPDTGTSSACAELCVELAQSSAGTLRAAVRTPGVDLRAVSLVRGARTIARRHARGGMVTLADLDPGRWRLVLHTARGTWGHVVVDVLTDEGA